MTIDASGGRFNSRLSVPISVNKAYDGKLFYVSTGIRYMTDAAETPLIFLENTSSDKTYVVTDFTAVLELSDQFGTMATRIYGNNNGGTIETNTAYTPVNRKIGSTNTAEVDCRLGQSGKTFSASDVLFHEEKYSAQLNGGGNNVIRIPDMAISIPPGENILVTHLPPASNTNQVLCASLTFYEV